MKLRIKSMIWNIRNQKTTNQNKKKKEAKKKNSPPKPQIKQNPTKKKNPKQKDPSVSSLWDNFQQSNIHIRRMPEEQKEQEIRNLFEKIMKGNFSNLVKEIDMQVHEAQRVPNKMEPKRPNPRHIIIKMQNLKSSKRKEVSYRGVTIDCQLISQRKLSRLEGIGKKYSKL